MLNLTDFLTVRVGICIPDYNKLSLEYIDKIELLVFHLRFFHVYSYKKVICPFQFLWCVISWYCDHESFPE